VASYATVAACVVYSAAATHLQTDVDRVACQPTQHRQFKHSVSRRDYLDHHERRPMQSVHLKSVRVSLRLSFGLWFPYARIMLADWVFAFEWAANSLQSDQDLRYDIRSMRPHLLQCMERQEVVPFPRLQHCSTKTNVRKIKEITV